MPPSAQNKNISPSAKESATSSALQAFSTASQNARTSLDNLTRSLEGSTSLFGKGQVLMTWRSCYAKLISVSRSFAGPELMAGTAINVPTTATSQSKDVVSMCHDLAQAHHTFDAATKSHLELGTSKADFNQPFADLKAAAYRLESCLKVGVQLIVSQADTSESTELTKAERQSLAFAAGDWNINDELTPMCGPLGGLTSDQ